MYAAQHADSCMKKFGKPYYEIHNFLDQYHEEYGIIHRIFFHHKLGLEIIVGEFGEASRDIAALHIREDIDGELPEDWSYFGPLPPDDSERVKKELRVLYGQEIYEEVSDKMREDHQ